MDLRGIPESKNYVDRTSAPWYDPNKMLAHVIMGMKRVIGDKHQAELDAKQAQMDANPIAPMTPQQEQANFNAKVNRDPSGHGWNVNKPDQPFSEFIPDVTDSGPINSILKNMGISK